MSAAVCKGCESCAGTHGDQADPDLDELVTLRAEVERLKAERKMNVESFDFATKQLLAQRDAAELARDQRQELLVDVARLVDGLGQNLISIPGMVKTAIDSQTTLANGYMRERNAQREESARLRTALGETIHAAVLEVDEAVKKERDRCAKSIEAALLGWECPHCNKANEVLGSDLAKKLRGGP